MRSKDRLAELRSLAGPVVYNETTVDVEDTEAEDEEIRKIFDEVERMRGWIQSVEDNTRLVARLHADAAYHSDKKLQEQLDAAVTQTNALGLKVCGALREFESRLGAGGGADGGGGGDGGDGGAGARARLRRLQYATTRRLYAEALTRHQRVLEAVHDQQARLLHEQIRITNLSITDEECENLLESKNLSLFVDNIQSQTAEARLALRDAEARHAGLLRVEGALRDVRDLFVQVAGLVAMQQDQLDTVLHHASAASAWVDGGQREILAGSVYAKKSRKKKLGLIICLVTGFLVVLFVLVAT